MGSGHHFSICSWPAPSSIMRFCRPGSTAINMLRCGGFINDPRGDSACFSSADCDGSFLDGKHHVVPSTGDLYIYDVDKSDVRAAYRCRTQPRFSSSSPGAPYQISANAASVIVVGKRNSGPLLDLI